MKAILIIDMPDSCETCPLRSYSNLALWCTALRKTKEEDDVCPLRQMPKKKEENDDGTHFSWHSNDWWNAGWNECIDEIMGETE